MELLKAHCGCKNWSSVWWWADGWVCWTEIAAVSILHNRPGGIGGLHWGIGVQWGFVSLTYFWQVNQPYSWKSGANRARHISHPQLIWKYSTGLDWKSSPSWAYWTPKSSMDTIDKNHLSYWGFSPPTRPALSGPCSDKFEMALDRKLIKQKRHSPEIINELDPSKLWWCGKKIWEN